VLFYFCLVATVRQKKKKKRDERVSCFVSQKAQIT